MEANGIVYLLSNPAMPGIVKIGLTSRENVESRIKELFSTSVPVPVDSEYACRVENCIDVESELHIAFSLSQIHTQGEFPKIEPAQAIAYLKLLGKDNAPL